MKIWKINQRLQYILMEHAVVIQGLEDMLLVENVDDRGFLCRLIEAMYGELPEPRKRK